MHKIVSVAAVIAIAASACSSKPREFTPKVAVPPTDMTKYHADHESCRRQVVSGKRSGFSNRVASGGAGVIAGVGAGAAGAAIASGSSTMVGAMAAASATVVLMPIAALAGAWGLAKRQKLKKENEIKQAMALCLFEAGYEVSGWEQVKHRKEAAKEKTASK